MRIPFHQVDAFAAEPLRGNPAGVCQLPAWPGDDLLVAVAAEVNAPETAFLVPDTPMAPTAAGEDFHLRWFTPTVEVDLCGHATLAAALVVITHVRPEAGVVTFDTRSGRLAVSREGDLLCLDLPAQSRDSLGPPPRSLARALGIVPLEAHSGGTWLVVLDSPEAVRALEPDIAAIAALDTPWVIVTAATGGTGPDGDVDFVSRFFAPGSGIDEDPVTGSAHCALAPFWSARLGKERLAARQVSRRGGEVDCELAGDRVRLRGRGHEVISGTMEVPWDGPGLGSA